jgi:hypothetical protein
LKSAGLFLFNVKQCLLAAGMKQGGRRLSPEGFALQI